jgi:hypothetical protein
MFFQVQLVTIELIYQINKRFYGHVISVVKRFYYHLIDNYHK